MENENIAESINNDSKCEIFRPEYENQNIKNNQNFINWEKSIFTKYGKDAKLFKCTEDNIYFYTSNKDCIEYPFYACRCPECNFYICYYCLGRTDHHDAEYGQCCIKRRLYYSFHFDALEYIRPIKPWDNEESILDKYTVLFFSIPFVNMIFCIYAISALFFYKMQFYNGDSFIPYENRFSNIVSYGVVLALNGLFAIALSIPFFLYNAFFLIILWIISIPFKLIPVKFVAGIITRGMVG